MKNPFRKPAVVYRKAPGSYQGMIYVPGEETRIDILANCQPLNSREMDETRVDAAGRKRNSFIKIYTDAELKTSPNPDAIIYRGERYIISEGGSYNNTNSDASHFKYYAALDIVKAEDTL